MLFLQVLPKAVWSLCPLLCSTWWTQGSKGGNMMVNLSNHGPASWSEREPKIPPCISPCSLVFCPLHASHWCYHLSCSLSLLPAFTLTLLKALSSSFYKFSQPNPLRFLQHERSLCIKMDMNLKVEHEEATNSELNTHFWTLNPPQEEGCDHFALFTVTEVQSLKAHWYTSPCSKGCLKPIKCSFPTLEMMRGKTGLRFCNPTSLDLSLPAVIETPNENRFISAHNLCQLFISCGQHKLLNVYSWVCAL